VEQRAIYHRRTGQDAVGRIQGRSGSKTIAQ